MTDSLFIGLSDEDVPQVLVLKRANRHGAEEAETHP